MSKDPEDQISMLYVVGGKQVMLLRDGTVLELSDNDVEMLESFFDPSTDDSADYPDEEENE